MSNRRQTSPSGPYADIHRLFLQQHWKKAVEHTQQRLLRAPGDPVLHALLAEGWIQCGEEAKALAACRQSLALKENQPIVLHRAAKLAQPYSQELALEYIQRAIELAPDEPLYHVTYLEILNAVGRWADFVSVLRDALERWPHSSELIKKQFYLLIKQEQFQAAYDYAQKNPTLKTGENLLNYGGVLTHIEGANAAVRHYDKALQFLMPHLPSKPSRTPVRTPAYMDVGQARAALLALKAALDGLRIPFFLVFGTLLGIVRDGELLPHDKDMDVGLPWATPRLELIEALLTMGFVCPQIEQYRAQPPQEYATIVHLKTMITIDFFFARPVKLDNGSTVVDMGFSKRPGEGVFWRYTPFAMAEIEYAGERFLAPNPPEQFLVETYGPQWKVPDANFDSCLLAHNLTDASIESGLAMGYNRLLGHLTSQNWKKARGYCEQMQTCLQRHRGKTDSTIEKLHQKLTAILDFK